jgi:cytoskeletal protein RodZ
MPTEITLSPKERARARLSARRRRAHRIRRSVVAFAVAAFIAAWLGIYVQIVEGKDPALSASRQQVARANTTTSTKSHKTSTKSHKAASERTASSASSSGSSSSSPTPVTTSQS